MLWRKESDVEGTRKAANDNRPFRIQPSKPAHLLFELVSLGLPGEQPENLSWEKVLESLFSTGTCTEWRGTERVKETNQWFWGPFESETEMLLPRSGLAHGISLEGKRKQVTFDF